MVSWGRLRGPGRRVGTAYKLVPSRDDPLVHRLLLPCPYTEVASNDAEEIARDTDGPRPELLGIEVHAGPATAPVMYCDIIVGLKDV